MPTILLPPASRVSLALTFLFSSNFPASSPYGVIKTTSSVYLYLDLLLDVVCTFTSIWRAPWRLLFILLLWTKSIYNIKSKSSQTIIT